MLVASIPNGQSQIHTEYLVYDIKVCLEFCWYFSNYTCITFVCHTYN